MSEPAIHIGHALATIRDAVSILDEGWRQGQINARRYHTAVDALRDILTRHPLCPACDGDGRIPDKTGGGHHGTCKTCGGSGVQP